MADKKPSVLDLFKAGYSKDLDLKDLLEKEEAKESKPKPSILNMIAEGYKKNEQK